MDFSQHGYIDLALILLVVFVLMLPRSSDSTEDVIIPAQTGIMCKCSPRYDLTLHNDETVTFVSTNQSFSVTDKKAIIDYLYGPYIDYTPVYGFVTVRAKKTVSFGTLYALTEHLKSNGAVFVSWSIQP